jgi:flagellar assembly protein FliH
MTAPAKFLFDDDFGSGPKAEKARPSVTQAVHEAGLGQARAQGYHQGFAAAEAKAHADAERRIAAALERIAAGLGGVAQQLTAIHGQLEAESVEVAVAVARKLASALIAREPIAEISALAADCFTHLVGVPHVVVRVGEDLYPAVQEKLEAMARMRGFEGRLVVLADPESRPGDCRIEWADGGVVRSAGTVETAIEEAVARYLATLHGAKQGDGR